MKEAFSFQRSAISKKEVKFNLILKLSLTESYKFSTINSSDLTKVILKELVDNGFINFLCKYPKKGYCGALCGKSIQRSAISVQQKRGY